MDFDLIRGTCWTIILLLFIIGILRIIAHDAVMVLLWVNSFTTFVYLPSYPILLYSVLKKDWRLIVLASIVIIFHLYSIRKDFLQNKYQSNLEWQMKLMNANLLAYNSEPAELIKEIKMIDPDILAVQEYTHRWHNAFTSAGFFKNWPFSTYAARNNTFGSAILSKMRIIQADSFYLDEMGVVQTRAEIDIGGKIVTVFNVHLVPPGIKHYSVHLQQQEKLLQVLNRYVGSPFILVGDFNVTEHSRFYSEILEYCSNAFDLAGVSVGTTWPNISYLFPLVRIDHVFLSCHLSCQSITTGHGVGSDHRPLIATIGFKEE